MDATAAVYNCPTCGQKMERDLLVFTKHTDAHVVEALQKLHPEWITQEGFCPICLEHYKAAMRGETVNIAGPEVAKRWTLMGLSILFSAILLFTLINFEAPKSWRLFLFIPLFAAFLGFFQAQRKTCVILGMKGTQNLGKSEEPLTNLTQASLLRSKSARILVWSLSLSALLTALAYLL